MKQSPQAADLWDVVISVYTASPLLLCPGMEKKVGDREEEEGEWEGEF